MLKCFSYNEHVLRFSKRIQQTKLKLNFWKVPFQICNYRPRSKASEGYVFTGVCHSFCSTGGGGGSGQHQWSTTTSPGPGQNIYPPPPPGPDQNIYPPPPRDQVRTSTPPPGPGQNIYPLPPPGTRYEHLPPFPLPPLRDYTPAGGTHLTGMHSCCIWKYPFIKCIGI